MKGKVKYRFKGLDMIDRVTKDLWMEVHETIEEAVIKTSPKKEMQKGKMLV